jgi:hypothetical protein
VDSDWVTNPPHEDRKDRSAPGNRRTYYDRSGVSVTERWLTVAGRRYRVDELANLRTARGPRDPFVVGATGAAGAAALALAVASPSLRSVGQWLVALVLVALPVLVALVAWRQRVRRFELWADYQGHAVQVLWTVDATRYGQICRALVRAQEGRAGFRATIAGPHRLHPVG